MHQSIPIVTTFLFNYLLVWDGEWYQKEILGLLEWIEMRNEEGIKKNFSKLNVITIPCKILEIDVRF